MQSIEVNELQQHLNEILRLVHEESQIVEVTNQGEAIALVVPVKKTHHPQLDDDSVAWDDLDRLATEIGRHWPKDVSAVEAVREIRQDD